MRLFISEQFICLGDVDSPPTLSRKETLPTRFPRPSVSTLPPRPTSLKEYYSRHLLFYKGGRCLHTFFGNSVIDVFDDAIGRAPKVKIHNVIGQVLSLLSLKLMGILHNLETPSTQPVFTHNSSLNFEEVSETTYQSKS
jgi:hypothetical protein